MVITAGLLVQARVSRLSTANRMGLEGPLDGGIYSLFAHKLLQMCSLSAASACEVATYLRVYISKLSRGPLSHPPLHSLPSDTLHHAERWSAPGDRGVCSPISKHSAGTWRKGPLNIPPVVLRG